MYFVQLGVSNVGTYYVRTFSTIFNILYGSQFPIVGRPTRTPENALKIGLFFFVPSLNNVGCDPIWV